MYNKKIIGFAVVLIILSAGCSQKNKSSNEISEESTSNVGVQSANKPISSTTPGTTGTSTDPNKINCAEVSTNKQKICQAVGKEACNDAYLFLTKACNDFAAKQTFAFDINCNDDCKCKNDGTKETNLCDQCSAWGIGCWVTVPE